MTAGSIEQAPTIRLIHAVDYLLARSKQTLQIMIFIKWVTGTLRQQPSFAVA